MAGGRPTLMTPEVLQKLEEAYMLDCTDGEACLSANIATSTLYAYQREHPEFLERKQELKQSMFLKARRTLEQGIQSNPDLALKYMERKKKDEFSLRSEHTGADGVALEPIKIVVQKKYEDSNE